MYCESLFAKKRIARVALIGMFLVVCLQASADPWRTVYTQSFNDLDAGTETTSKSLSNWEGGSAAGVVFDGRQKGIGKFLIAKSSWFAFNQGPIVNVDLAATPHDRVRVKFDLYTFGDWRGLQAKTGGPQHRLMFFDSKADPAFAFDTNFATNARFQQSWPQKNPARNKAAEGAEPLKVDATGRFANAHRWPIEFEYASDSPALRFTFLCGAAAGSGTRMPPFGIDNVEVSVRSTAPTIHLVDDEKVIQQAADNRSGIAGSPIKFDVKSQGRHSLGIFDSKSGELVRTLRSGEDLPVGEHTVFWDGRDHRGRTDAAGEYQWRLLSTPGFTARYVTTIGINPPGGEDPTPKMSWVGDHLGAGIVDVDDSGVYIGSPMTEGGRMMLKANPDMSGVLWRRGQFYQGGRLTKLATSGQHLYSIHPTGKLRRYHRDTGKLQWERDIAIDGKPPADVDAQGDNLVVIFPGEGVVRWLSREGELSSEHRLANCRAVAVMEDTAGGAAYVAAGKLIHRVQPGKQSRLAATLAGDVVAMDYDPARKELWAVIDGHQVVCLDNELKVTQTYDTKPRPFGKYDPSLFAGINDIAADLKGGFYIGEPSHPPRRIAHFSRDGKLIDQWYGGMSFYVNATFDPADPTILYGVAPEGFANVYRIDYEQGDWQIEACYATGRLGDGMFPFTGSFRAVQRGGQTYLYHRVIPAVLKLDAESGQAIPLAIAGRVINRGRTFSQFAGTGRDGYPRPWVAAAEHHGYRDLAKAPKLYSWADADGDGEFDPEEFVFYPHAKRGVSFHNAGDYLANGDYVGGTNVNEPNALVHLPVVRWEGPHKAAPRWDWEKAQAVGEITADSYGYGSPRGVSAGPDGSVSVTYQAGIMIRGHGQYEGGGWPEAALRGARVLAFDKNFRPTLSVGRQSKDAREVNTGVLFYPMQTLNGPNRSIVINDQTRQPAQVWTHDGLYAGGFFDNRADDGLDAGFYQLHGDDNQGGAIVTAANGKTYWLMPYQGHNRLYEIDGWNDWQRQRGTVVTPKLVPRTTNESQGLTARYYEGTKLALETIETPTYYEQFGAQRHAGKVTPHYKVTWTGRVTPPLSDRYHFASLLGSGEQLAVWIDGHLVHAAGFGKSNIDEPVELIADRDHNIRIEYINPSDRSELKLLWRSRTLDPSPISAEFLTP